MIGIGKNLEKVKIGGVKTVSARGGEKNYIIELMLKPLNIARNKQNHVNFTKLRKERPNTTKDEFKRYRAFLPPLDHSRIIIELKKAYGKWENIKESQLYELLSICKQSDDFSWTFWGRLKKARENRKKVDK